MCLIPFQAFEGGKGVSCVPITEPSRQREAIQGPQAQSSWSREQPRDQMGHEGLQGSDEDLPLFWGNGNSLFVFY